MPIERILCIDFETKYCSKTYTLKKMTNEEYIRSPRFKSWGAAVHWVGDEAPPVYYRTPALMPVLAAIDWSTTAVLAHNAQFDVAILAWHFGHYPAMIFDTLSMARARRGVEGGNSLAQLALDLDLPAKGKAIHSTDGLEELPEQIHNELADYCVHDTWLCERIFEYFVSDFPRKELGVIDMTLQMYVKAMLRLDTDILTQAIAQEKLAREALLSRLKIDESALASNDKFAEILRMVGVEPPTKKSKTTGKTAWAFAKNDAMFQALINSDNEDVALLCEARLKVKSTLERTRAQRFLDIAGRGTLPIPLTYFGAHTGRWSAAKGSNINLQNLKRGSFLRHAILAPDGCSFVVGDLSQIEVRVLAALSDNQPVLDAFHSGDDVYAVFGREMFSVPELTKESHPVLRQSAKSALLGAGYGLGAFNFAAQLLTGFLGAPPLRYDTEMARQVGVAPRDYDNFVRYEPFVEKALAIPRLCTDEEIIVHAITAKKIIDKFRAVSPAVVDFWADMDALIERSLYGGEVVQYKCLEFSKEQIKLPSGMCLQYRNLRQVQNEETKRWEWVFDLGRKTKKLWGGIITENVCQAVARCVMSDAMLRINKKVFVALTVHDEIVTVARSADADRVKAFVRAEMTKPVPYLPGMPLDASIESGVSYGDAK